MKIQVIRLFSALSIHTQLGRCRGYTLSTRVGARGELGKCCRRSFFPLCYFVSFILLGARGELGKCYRRKFSKRTLFGDVI
jgi:hypothetical protein